MTPRCRWLASVLWVLACGAPQSVWAQADVAKSVSGIYTCTDDRGRRLTSDRPIPECTAKEQRVLNRDGSQRSVLPPTLTAEERAAREVRELDAAQARAEQADAVRRDRNLVARFPNEAAHTKSRGAALDTVRVATKATELRLRDLATERKPLTDEAEFYAGKPLPAKLKTAMDANDAALEAQRSAVANQQSELARINSIYDLELDRLRRLWGGAAAGSLGLLPGDSSKAVSSHATKAGPAVKRVRKPAPPKATTAPNAPPAVQAPASSPQ
jgi:hypothetical protein